MKLPASEGSLITRLLEMQPAERAECLRRVFAEHPDLRVQLREVARAVSELESESRPASLPSSDAERARVIELAFTRQEAVGASIGPYKLIREIGEGGFGVVWLAEQQDPIRRRVALKVIKSGLDTREVIARFEVERQALALMEHPGITRVFDAGTTESGRPYFVMELVHGIPITKYCDDNRMPVEARLRLFIAVCRAMQHAHQKGIIHRDLKPSNIIVAVHDGLASPKIIDFGIAKATEATLAEKTLFTRFHAFIGTPAYTSPEQMEMNGLDVDTRSDIYSLGVLLYELLAGRPPFDPDQLQKSSLEEMRRTIREVEPPTPSKSVRALPEEPRASVAQRRSAAPSNLAETLRGDLDWIVMHCLEKDRARRYETTSGLAADVGRYLDNEPVTARPASRAYRLQKLIRRNRLAVVAGAAVVFSLTAGLVVASVALVRERAARARESTMRLEADTNARQARTEAAKSEQVSRFMKEMLSGVGPSAALGRDRTMLREILDTTARRLDTALRDQPEVATDLRETLALVYRDLGRQAEAEALLREVVDARRKFFGGESVELASALTRHGSALGRINRSAEADAALQEALAIRRKLLGGEDPAVAETLFELAQVVVPSRSLADSVRMLSEALTIRRKAFGAEHVSIAETIEALGTRARWNFDHRSAVKLHSEALAMYRKLLGNDHPAVARSLDSLGYSIRHIDPTPEARAPYRESFFLRRTVLGAEHPDVVVALLRYIGMISALEADREVLDLVHTFIAEQREKLPGRSPLLAPSLLVFAVLLERPERDPMEAARLVSEARVLIDESITNGQLPDIEVVDAMALYGWWKFMDGDAAEGRTMCEQGLKLMRATHGETHAAFMMPNHILSWVYFGAGWFDEAIVQFTETLRVLRAKFPPNHPFLGLDVAGLGAALRRAGRIEESRQDLETALELWKWGRESGVRFPRSIPVVMCELGLTLNRDSKFAEAEHALRESLRAYDRGEMAEVALRIVPRARAESGLGAALSGQGKFAEAEPLLVHAYEELKAGESTYGGDGAALVRDAHEAVVAHYIASERPEKVAYWQALRP